MAQPPAQETPETPPDAPTPTKFEQTYSTALSKLPPSVSAVLPSPSAASSAVSVASDKFSALGTASKAAAGEVSKTSSQRVEALRKASKAGWKKAGPEAWCACAWAVRNETSIPLNVSLNQVGPLYYEVLKPEETFERRVPSLPYALEIRPYTSPSTAYTPWSTTWPILAVTGPVVAVASLLALPFVAVAAGGTALASLSSVGSSIAAGAASASDAAVGTAATATALVAKASSLPGARQVKGRLADAAKKAVGEHVSREKVQQHVVRYLTTARNAGGGAAAGGVIEEVEHEEAKRKESARKHGKVEEIDVTGYDVEKVLVCETGNAKVDKALAKAFKRLSMKSKLREYKTESNPVLRVVGGPELETRTPPSSFLHPNPAPRTYLVFYPFTVLHAPADVRAEPVPLDEVPPTEDEARVMDKGRVVESWEAAEKASREAPPAAAEVKPEEVDKKVAQAEEEVGEAQRQVEAEAGKGKAPVEGEKSKKKGWLW
ncbi:hypothetical protein JCM10213_000920 [Rhodosporidiobolus nylandii]